jgi:CHAD domain-containing protein
MSLQFDFPTNLNAEKFIAKLSEKVDIEFVSKQFTLKTYYDSFDWRLYKNNLTCEFNRSKSESLLIVRNIENNLVIASTDIKEIPKFTKEINSESINQILNPLLDMRALLPMCNLDYVTFYLNILNKDKKTLLRLLVEEHELLNNRVTLLPIKGYEKATEHLVSIITTKLELTPTNKSLMNSALRLQGRKPNDYSSKININLDPEMRADIAIKYIYSHLLKAIKDNEQGAIADIDSEFLHDFRVAVRRTRSGLSQLKGVIPEKINTHYADFFSWLGQITGPTRDLDVYLLNFAHYKNSLPVTIRDDLDPLYEFLLIKQRKAQKELAKKLCSAQYLTILSEWKSFLKEQAPVKPIEPNANLTIEQFANSRILKNYNRVLKQGNKIDENSPPEALHDLRKSCKKLRYLMEFFQSLYAEQQVKLFIKNLKALQQVLGDFQDYAVQESTLKLFSEEMLIKNTSANTLMAIGVLIQNLHAFKEKARKDFSDKFHTFSHIENQFAIKRLLTIKD